MVKRSRGKSKTPASDGHAPRVVISGYYGFDNLGDELILQVLTDELKAMGTNITVLSQKPAQTSARYGVKAVHRMRLFEIMTALMRADLFISGGGGLFQDATGPASPIYYGGLIHIARFFKVPTTFVAQGVGPLTTDLARKMTASALKKSDVITVRDDKSAALVRELSGMPVKVTGDPVWLLKPGKPRSRLSAEQASVWTIGVSLRPWPSLTPERLGKLAAFLESFAEGRGQRLRFLLLPFQPKEDRRVLAQFADALGNPAQAEWVEPEDVLNRVRDCDLLVGMRFHSLVLGLLANVPVYGLSYDPKVAALLSHFGLQGVDIESIDSLDATEVENYFHHRYPVIDLAPLKKQARKNFQPLKPLLSGTLPD